MKLPLANSSPWIKWPSAIAALTFAVLIVNSWDKLRSWAPVTRGGMEAYAGELLEEYSQRQINIEILALNIQRELLIDRLDAMELRGDAPLQELRDLNRRNADLDRIISAAECEQAILSGRPFLGCGM